MWTLDALWRDPLEATVVSRHNITSRIARFSCRLDDWLTLERQKQCQKAGRVAEIAVADYVARVISNTYYQDHQNDDNGVTAVWFEPIDRTTQRSYYYSSSSSSRRTKNGNKNTESKSCPFQLERTDITVVNHQILQMYFRFFFVLATEATTTIANNNDQRLFSMAQQTGENVLHSLLSLEKKPALIADLMHHVAVAILQDRLRRKLNEIEAVAFIANGAILPRKSGASMAPMTSPPAIPFRAPTDSHMCRTIVVEDIPEWIQYFDEDDDSDEELDNHNGNKNMIRPFQIKNPKNGCSGTYLEVTGLVIPKGVSLIVGGGYHGKSTLLRCIAAGVYNKVPGDGREFCVTVETAVAIRAEDGRYINNCNVSGFISNLPTAAADTQHFSTGEASGSTSQAANVVEAMEMGAKALLVDEDGAYIVG
jgi:predicted ABC-class ATPase